MRTKALVLEALAAVDPQGSLGARLAEAILAARQDGAWRTTQDAAYALFALAAVERAETSGRERRATLRPSRRGSGRDASRSVACGFRSRIL